MDDLLKLKYIHPAELKHTEELDKVLRQEDRDELEADGEGVALESLVEGYENSKYCFTIKLDDGAVVGMIGLVETPNPEYGVVWGAFGDRIAEIKKSFVYNANVILDRFNDECKYLVNAVDGRNITHISWLLYTGAVFDLEPLLIGPRKLPFFSFRREKYV